MPVVFALGFRPFFLLAGFFAIFLTAVWVPAFVGSFAFDTSYGQIGWHSHEMVFGYSSAVIAGFLLTAVRNWTARPTPTGGLLASLAVLWLLGRILPYFPGTIPHGLIAIVDLAFLPALTVSVGVPLVRSGERRNWIFLPLLAVFWAGNFLVHAELLGLVSNLARRGIFLGLNLVVLLIVIMGGRVIPFFTERALSGAVMKRWPVIEWLSPGSVILFLLAEFFLPDSLLSAGLAALAACANGIRLAGWYTARYWRVPLLWVLHLGYAWVVAGFILKFGAALGIVPHQFTIHAFTVGGIGVLTLGMMARVALGHSGRPLRVGLAVTMAFGLVNLSGVTRGLLPILFPQWFSQLISASGALWIAAFAIFVILYTPILTQARPDG
ncbi:MAG TPA: NnrS family protein, partial [Candidatus Limnocylindria bacterium]|nr:NnrS family protein [Candidatus Limnocylindria bacterium]